MTDSFKVFPQFCATQLFPFSTSEYSEGLSSKLSQVKQAKLDALLTFSASPTGSICHPWDLTLTPVGVSESFTNEFQGNEDFILCSSCAGWANDVQLETTLCSSAVKRIFANDLNEHWVKLMAKSSRYAEIHGSY